MLTRKQALVFLKHYDQLNQLYYKASDVLDDSFLDQHFGHLFDHTKLILDLLAGREITDEEYGQSYSILLNHGTPTSRYNQLKEILL